MESDRNENFTGEVTAAVSSSTDITTKKGFDDAEQTENLEVSTCTQHDPCSASKQTVTEEKEAKKTLQSEITQLAPGEGNDSLETASDFTSENEPVIKSANQIPSGAEAVNHHQENFRIILLGKTGAGKSTTANTILGRACLPTSCSSSSVTKECSSNCADRLNRRINVIDTPGFFDTSLPQEKVEEQILECIALAAPGPHAFILVLNISRFTKEEEEIALRSFELFENAVSKYFIVLFTRLDDLEHEGKTIEDYISSGPQDLKNVLQKCDGRFIAFNNRYTDKKRDQQVEKLLDIIDKNLSKKQNKYYTDEMFQEADRILKEKEKGMKQKSENELKLKYEKMRGEIKEKYKDVENVMKLQREQLEKMNTRAEHNIEEFLQKIENLDVNMKEIENRMNLELTNLNEAEIAENRDSNEPSREGLIEKIRNSGTTLTKLFKKKSGDIKTSLFSIFKKTESQNVAKRQGTEV